MDKKRRDQDLRHAQWADIADFLCYVLVLLAFFLSLTSIDKNSGPAIVLAIWAGGIRIRMILRATRIDTLIREAEEEAGNPTPPVETSGGRQATCPKCGIPFRFATDYNHNNISCPHCGALVRVV